MSRPLTGRTGTFKGVEVPPLSSTLGSVSSCQLQSGFDVDHAVGRETSSSRRTLAMLDMYSTKTYEYICGLRMADLADTEPRVTWNLPQSRSCRHGVRASSSGGIFISPSFVARLQLVYSKQKVSYR
ncbi:hypothetical protein PLICRDRAFT_50322 [Plicaturopsis crispa FD-325 SS-3]|nr:hypothetical protein PLICRDRAFT_50322 [Plicaturopsis crispa FD-325 SS-3]